MNSVVIYASRSGNTRQIAEAVAEALGHHGAVTTWAVDDAPGNIPAGTDLLVIGGPTEAHGITTPLAGYLGRLELAEPDRLSAAAFDTRLRWPRALSGSAASGIAKFLRANKVRVVAPDESFFVSKKPVLEPGELERATSWAESLAAAMPTPVATAR